MPDQSAPVMRARGNRVLFWLLALAISIAAAAAATFLRVSFLGLGFLVSLVLYGTLAWFFGHYERPLWWVAAPLLFLGDALFGWAWSVAVQGGIPAGPFDYARALLLFWPRWKLLPLLAALAGSWLGARSRGHHPVVSNREHR